MKKTKFVLVGLVVILLSALAAPSFASPTATANAGGTIASQIAITQDSSMDLEFGIIKPDTVASSTVKVDPDPEATYLRSKDGDCVLLNGITPALAVFTVTGAPLETYAITLPEDEEPGVTITHAVSDHMSVTDFQSYPEDHGKLSAGGSQKLKVGATLHVAANQAVGRYTGPFSVTVAYN